MTIDRMSNMLSSIKNAAMAGKTNLEFFHSNQCEEVAKVLKSKGFLEGVRVFKPKDKAYKMLSLDLSQDASKAVLTDIKIVSKPGRRIYKSYHDLYYVAGGEGVLVVSTSRGIMDGIEAKKKKLGGEVICEVK